MCLSSSGCSGTKPGERSTLAEAVTQPCPRARAIESFTVEIPSWNDSLGSPNCFAVVGMSWLGAKDAWVLFTASGNEERFSAESHPSLIEVQCDSLYTSVY